MSSKILVVEDNDTTAEMLALFLTHAGYRTARAVDGRAALAAIDASIALVLLDLMLPDIDGLSVCRQIRSRGGPPVLMLTARVSEDDIVEGLQSGADDYVCKPFRSKELLARIDLCLQRQRQQRPTTQRLQMGEISINCEQRLAWAADRELRLTRSEFELLRVLIGSPGRVYTREQLIAQAFGPDYVGGDRTVDTHIWSLRKKLGEPRGEPRYLHAEPGVGYRMWDRHAP